MADFPTYAVLLREGFSQKRASAVSRTQMDDGMVKQLKTKSRVLVTRPVKYGFPSLAEFQSFIEWYETTIDGGVDWFNWTDPVDSTVKLARIVSELADETPDTPTLDYWIVSFNIETWGNG